MRHTSRRLLSIRLAAFALLVLVLPSWTAAQSTDEVRYYHSDAVGSVRVITDDTGQVTARYDYLPFGERWPSADPADPRMYAGKERDADTGLDYFGARYYGAVTGRFTSVDPDLGVETALTDPQRWNRYAYVGNRPVKLTDPDGRGWASALFKVGKAVYKGGSVAAEFASVVEDARTLISAESTAGERAWAAASIASELWSPVSIGDATGAVLFAQRGAQSAAGEVRTVIGKLGDLKNLGPGERSLLDRLPDLQNPRANWSQNAGVLRKEMARGQPIRDASVDPTAGALLNNRGFLRAERHLLESRGWIYDPKTTMWHPPLQ